MPELLHAPADASPPPEDVAARARLALAEAERRGIPPDPRAFALFYAYVEGGPDDLCTAVDQILPAGGPPPPLDAVDRLHDAHVTDEHRARRFSELGQLIGAELGTLGASLARQVKSDDAFLDRLSEARAGMSLFARPGTVKQVLRDLIETTEGYAEQTELFAAELAGARRQIAELTAELATVRETAHLDHLTGLANRRRLDAALEREIAAAPHGGGFSLVLADLDHFKRVNDEFGHGVGDAVLRQFARLLREELRADDLPARFGGEEFAMILPGADRLGARHAAERIRQSYASRAFVVAGTKRSLGALTASFGVAEHRDGETAAVLIARADDALYRAKRTGRNRVADDA